MYAIRDATYASRLSMKHGIKAQWVDFQAGGCESDVLSVNSFDIQKNKNKSAKMSQDTLVKSFW